MIFASIDNINSYKKNKNITVASEGNWMCIANDFIQMDTCKF